MAFVDAESAVVDAESAVVLSDTFVNSMQDEDGSQEDAGRAFEVIMQGLNEMTWWDKLPGGKDVNVFQIKQDTYKYCMSLDTVTLSLTGPKLTPRGHESKMVFFFSASHNDSTRGRRVDVLLPDKLTTCECPSDVKDCRGAAEAYLDIERHTPQGEYFVVQLNAGGTWSYCTVDKESKFDIGGVTYRLIGCVLHTGDAARGTCGHYTMCAKCQDGWYYANDSQVEKFDTDIQRKGTPTFLVFSKGRAYARLPRRVTNTGNTCFAAAMSNLIFGLDM